MLICNSFDSIAFVRTQESLSTFGSVFLGARSSSSSSVCWPILVVATEICPNSPQSSSAKLESDRREKDARNLFVLLNVRLVIDMLLIRFISVDLCSIFCFCFALVGDRIKTKWNVSHLAASRFNLSKKKSIRQFVCAKIKQRRMRINGSESICEADQVYSKQS